MDSTAGKDATSTLLPPIAGAASKDANASMDGDAFQSSVKTLSRRALNTTSSVYKIEDPDVQPLLFWYQQINNYYRTITYPW